jgi:hypothetical protein
MKVSSMASFCGFAVVLLLASPVTSVKVVHDSASSKASNAITEIVKQLKSMAEKSEKDGEEEEATFKKFECFSKKAISNKTAWIEKMTDDIETAKINMEQNSAKQSECETKAAQLKKDFADNALTQNQTIALRKKSRAAFLTEEGDITNALQQLGSAFDALSTNASSSLLQIQPQNPALASLFQRLQAVSKSPQNAFLAVSSDPRSQSNGVVGILKNTRDTYAQNLKDLRGKESADQATHDNFMAKLQDKSQQLQTMEGAAHECVDESSQQLVTQGKFVKDETALLESQKSSKADLEKVLGEKTKSFEDRSLLRSQEDAAISKAVSILNSDDAFKSFNKVSSSLLQVVDAAGANAMRRKLQLLSYLRSQAEQSKSIRLAQLAVLVSGEDPEKPFDKVLKEIADMKDVIDKEQVSDEKKRDSCSKDVSENKKALIELGITISAQDEKVTDAMNTLGNVESQTGLLNDLNGESGSKVQLKANFEEQKAATESRTRENQDYQQNVADLEVAQNLIKQAMKVLKAYSDNLELVQENHAEDSRTSSEPKYEEGKFSGQSTAGTGVMKLMQAMLDNTAKAEAQAHRDEHTAQASFEKSMKTLTENEETLKTEIVNGNKQIAETRLALSETKALLADAKKQKAATEKYLLDIKPSCDFIAANFDKRVANRVAEKDSLDNGIRLLKGTPAYQN